MELMVVVRFECLPYRSHPAGGLNHHLHPVGADHDLLGVGSHLDRLESGLEQHLFNPIAIGQREGTRFTRAGHGWQRSCDRHHGQTRHQHPLVDKHILPTGESHSPSVAQGTTQVAEGRHRVGKEHDAELGEDGVERSRAEVGGLRITDDELDVVHTLADRPGPRHRQHRRGDVHSDCGSPRGHPAGQFNGRGPRPTPHIEDSDAGFEGQMSHGPCPERPGHERRVTFGLDPRRGTSLPVLRLGHVAIGRITHPTDVTRNSSANDRGGAAVRSPGGHDCPSAQRRLIVARSTSSEQLGADPLPATYPQPIRGMSPAEQ